jgi:hypothetical protein
LASRIVGGQHDRLALQPDGVAGVWRFAPNDGLGKSEMLALAARRRLA